MRFAGRLLGLGCLLIAVFLWVFLGIAGTMAFSPTGESGLLPLIPGALAGAMSWVFLIGGWRLLSRKPLGGYRLLLPVATASFPLLLTGVSFFSLAVLVPVAAAAAVLYSRSSPSQ